MVSVVLRMTDPLYCSLNILFGDVLITVAQSIVVVIKRLGDVPVHTGDLSQHVPGTHPCSFFMCVHVMILWLLHVPATPLCYMSSCVNSTILSLRNVPSCVGTFKLGLILT